MCISIKFNASFKMSFSCISHALQFCPQVNNFIFLTSFWASKMLLAFTCVLYYVKSLYSVLYKLKKVLALFCFHWPCYKINFELSRKDQEEAETRQGIINRFQYSVECHLFMK